MEKRRYNYSKLKGLIKEKCGTQAEYAKIIGISTTTLNERFKSETYFSTEEMRKTIEYFKLDLSSLKDIFFVKE